MSEPTDEHERWWRELDEALREPGSVPPAVVEAAYGAYTWRTLEAELAELTFDSRTGDPALARSRSQPGGPRTLTFSSGSLTIELEVGSSGVLGQLVPPQPAEVSVRTEDGDLSVHAADELGCFTVEPVPATPFQLRVRADRIVSTGWVRP